MSGLVSIGWNLYGSGTRPIYQSEPKFGVGPMPVFELEPKLGSKPGFFMDWNQESDTHLHL